MNCFKSSHSILKSANGIEPRDVVRGFLRKLSCFPNLTSVSFPIFPKRGFRITFGP